MKTSLPTSTATKRCRLCGLVKPLSAFGPNRSRSDGRQCECRECRLKESRRKRGSLPRLFARLTTAELLAEIARRDREAHSNEP